MKGMRIIKISYEEINFLREEIKQKYELLTNEELVITTYQERFDKLVEIVNSVSLVENKEFSSSGLFVKLLEPEIADDAVVSFNRGFLDACYRFISDGNLNRGQYLADSDSSFSYRPHHTRWGWSYGKKRIHLSIRRDVLLLLFVSTLLFLGLSWMTISNWQYIMLEIKGNRDGPKHVWWYAQYPDSTVVFNRPRRYRTATEVKDYFYGSTLRQGGQAGDCNALVFDIQNKKFSEQCFNSVEAIDRFEAEHGGKPIKVEKGTP